MRAALEDPRGDRCRRIWVARKKSFEPAGIALVLEQSPRRLWLVRKGSSRPESHRSQRRQV